jgi:2,3-dihydroxybenzoate decarboxylase
LFAQTEAIVRGKIALEEHFENPAYPTVGEGPYVTAGYAAEVARKRHDPAIRIAEMDQFGIETTIVSLTAPGIQGEPDVAKAVRIAREQNDYALRTYVEPYRGRLLAFAAVPLQDPRAAADELERAVTQLGFKGALVNGFSNIGDEDTAWYLDDPHVLPFWERVDGLGVPVYLHPRIPLASQTRALAGYPALTCSPWGFGRETSEHALRLILSGLFDRFPKLTIILGHMGEGLTFTLPRLESRLRHFKPGTHGPHKLPPTHYLRQNFYLTTSGVFRTSALLDAMLEVGSDRLLFSVDYPYESTAESASWFDNCPISEADRTKIGRTNARALFQLDSPKR